MHFVTDDSMKTFSAPSSNDGYTLTCVGNRISALLRRLALHMKGGQDNGTRQHSQESEAVSALLRNAKRSRSYAPPKNASHTASRA